MLGGSKGKLKEAVKYIDLGVASETHGRAHTAKSGIGFGVWLSNSVLVRI